MVKTWLDPWEKGCIWFDSDDDHVIQRPHNRITVSCFSQSKLHHKAKWWIINVREMGVSVFIWTLDFQNTIQALPQQSQQTWPSGLAPWWEQLNPEWFVTCMSLRISFTSYILIISSPYQRRSDNFVVATVCCRFSWWGISTGHQVACVQHRKQWRQWSLPPDNWTIQDTHFDFEWHAQGTVPHSSTLSKLKKPVYIFYWDPCLTNHCIYSS